MVWYQPGISAEQTMRDLADCQNESLAYGRSSVFAGEQTAARALFDSMAESSRQNQIVQTCMIAKGYSLVKTNSTVLTNSQPQRDSVINAKLLGHWTFVPSSEGPLRGQLDIYFLPQNRYKSNSSMINTNGQPFSPTPEQEGRYYFAGNKLVTWGDKDEKPDPPGDISVTDTQLTIHNKTGDVVFQKQLQ